VRGPECHYNGYDQVPSNHKNQDDQDGIRRGDEKRSSFTDCDSRDPARVCRHHKEICDPCDIGILRGVGVNVHREGVRYRCEEIFDIAISLASFSLKGHSDTYLVVWSIDDEIPKEINLRGQADKALLVWSTFGADLRL